MKTNVFGRWGDAHIGRPEDQPLVLALVLVSIAITLYFFI
jgi:hypothetical protein